LEDKDGRRSAKCYAIPFFIFHFSFLLMTFDAILSGASWPRVMPFLLKVEHDVLSKLIVQKSNPEHTIVTYRFHHLKKGVFRTVLSDGAYAIHQMAPLPPPVAISEMHRESSSIYREYLVYLANQGIEGVSLQRIVYESLGWTLVSIPPFHRLSTSALQHLLHDNHIRPVQYMSDQFDSLRYLMRTLGATNEAAAAEGQGNFLLMSPPEHALIWAFAPWQVRPIAANASAWHLDATYKLFVCKHGLFAVVVRGPSGRGIPVCYFIVGKEDSESIGFVIKAFCEWVGVSPGAWIHDCQSALIRAIEDECQSSVNFLCVFHAIRT
jgi:hypothetical protein